VKADLERFPYIELNPVETLISTIPAKKRRVFVDPFPYKESTEVDEAQQPPVNNNVTS
jgi:hypothetical protein